MAMGHCTKCGVALAQPDHHICPVPGGDNLFCGKCGAPHEPKGKVCAACNSPLNQG
jgi:predicted amidophosphoribosyltransferase